ncbi:MAG: glycerol-3-phosphate acyltransferase [Anaerolineae bacterium]|nr:glycerol-3-phosphate acyltransferase [Anaerolineae bacterium]
MNIWLALLAAAVGYLLGAISFARVIFRWMAPGQEITGMELDIPGTEEKVRVEAVSGTAVSTRLGAKWGGITAILDILKTLIPTLVFRFALPDTSYFLIVAAMGLVGHNWPLYYRFKGGRGLSPIYGGFLAVAPLGALITSTVSMIVGLLVLKNVLISYLGGLWLMIPWLWFTTRDPAHLAYVLFVNIVFALAMIPEIRGILDRKRRGVEGDFVGAMEMTPMGRMIKKMANRVGWMKEKTEQN